MVERQNGGEPPQILKVGIAERSNGGKKPNPRDRNDGKSPEILKDGSLRFRERRQTINQIKNFIDSVKLVIVHLHAFQGYASVQARLPFPLRSILKWKLVDCPNHVKMFYKSVQTLLTIAEPPKEAKSKNKSSSIIVHGSMHAGLNMTICSLFMPWRIFVSFDRRFSWSSSLSNLFIATSSPCPFLATKTKPNDPRSIASSFSPNSPFNWKRVKPWQTRDWFALEFPYSGNLNVILNAYWSTESTICALLEIYFVFVFWGWENWGRGEVSAIPPFHLLGFRGVFHRSTVPPFHSARRVTK